MGGFLKIVSTVLKALNYDGKRNRRDNGVNSDAENDAGGSRRRPPSAPSQRKPPVIRIRRERSLNGVQWGSPQQQLSASENNLLSVTKPSAKVKTRQKASSRRRSPSNEVPARLVPDVITTSASFNNINRPIERQVIRIINGADPSVQSQVLLNTKTSQPWHELVRDLGMAVKIGRRKVGNRMETLTGRMIQSYSQLRSELKVGNQAFYVYSESDDEDLGLIPNLQKHRLSVNSISTHNGGGGRGSTRLSRSNSRSSDRKKSLAKTLSVSSSDLSLSSSDPKIKRSPQRRRSHARSPNRSARSQNPSPVPTRSPSPGNVHRLKAPLPQIV